MASRVAVDISSAVAQLLLDDIALFQIRAGLFVDVVCYSTFLVLIVESFSLQVLPCLHYIGKT